MWIQIQTILFMLLAFNVVSIAQTSAVPKGWKQARACGFSFLLPKDLVEVKKSPIDSCLSGFYNHDISISLDYGWYSNPGDQAEWDTQYKRTKININGRPVELITFVTDRKKLPTNKPIVTEIYLITNDGRSTGAVTALLFSISTRESVDPKIAKQIYESIRYLGK